MLTQEESTLAAEAVRIALMVFCSPGTEITVTCEQCGDNDVCEYAFDHYNTNGDCLALK